MGTTVTLDDDAGSGTAGLKPFVVEPQSCGWMPGIDPLRLTNPTAEIRRDPDRLP